MERILNSSREGHAREGKYGAFGFSSPGSWLLEPGSSAFKLERASQTIKLSGNGNRQDS